jgi:tetratricopeptide (TPR) repeat protein
MADIFLSYARESADSAMEIAAILREEGYSVWFDESLPAHRAYSDVIEEQLEAARAVLVLWSKEATTSQWVRSEANRARETGRLVQLRLDDARLPMPFDQIQCADLRNWSGDTRRPCWLSVEESVAALVERAPVLRPEASPTGARVQRRQLLIAGASVAGLSSLGFAGWRALQRPEISPQAQLLMQKGFDALQDNDVLDPGGPGSTMQAIALLTQATAAAPDAAVAWGGLALAYAVRKRTVPGTERPGLDLRSRAAAKRSLEIDPREGRALGALLLLDPVYRHWQERERADRAAVRENGSIPLLFSITADLLGNVGRWNDALSFSRNIDRNHFLIPGAERKYIVDLWASGDLQAADNSLQTAVERWPQNPQIWRTRVPYLMYSGRPAEALDLLREGAERPTDIDDGLVRALRSVAEALAGERPSGSAVQDTLAFLRPNHRAALRVANACCALGALDDAFEILDGYYFGEGKWAAVAPTAGDADRITDPLFLPPMKPAWTDRRFDSLLTRIGLASYWRATGTQPDYRRS